MLPNQVGLRIGNLIQRGLASIDDVIEEGGIISRMRVELCVRGEMLRGRFNAPGRNESSNHKQFCLLMSVYSISNRFDVRN